MLHLISLLFFDVAVTLLFPHIGTGVTAQCRGDQRAEQADHRAYKMNGLTERQHRNDQQDQKNRKTCAERPVKLVFRLRALQRPVQQAHCRVQGTPAHKALLHPLPMCRGERAPHRAASAAEYRAIRQAPTVKGYRPATDPHWFFSSFHSLPPNFIYMSCYSARNGVITLRPSLLPWAPRPSRSPEPPYRGLPSGKS